jgi:hypothetical protein
MTDHLTFGLRKRKSKDMQCKNQEKQRKMFHGINHHTYQILQFSLIGHILRLIQQLSHLLNLATQIYLLKILKQSMRSFLMDALQNARVNEAYYKCQLVGQQAGMIMQSIYCERVWCQLAIKEGKSKKGKKKLLGDGMPRLLTTVTQKM